MDIETPLDAKTLQNGLELALKDDIQPLLCMVAPNLFRLAAAYEDGTVLSWEQAPLSEIDSSAAFIIPAKVARMLSGGALEDLDSLDLWASGKEVRLQLHNGEAITEIRWQWSSSVMPSPSEMEPMLTAPQSPVTVRREELAFAIEQASQKTQKLGPDARPQDNLLAVAQVAPTVSVDDYQLERPAGPVTYFAPHTLRRALALIGEDENDQLSLQVEHGDKHATLTLVGKHAGWRVQCAMKAAFIGQAKQSRANANTDALASAPTSTSAPAHASTPAPAHANNSLPTWQPPQTSNANDAPPLNTGQLKPSGRRGKPLDAMRLALLDSIEALEETDPNGE